MLLIGTFIICMISLLDNALSSEVVPEVRQQHEYRGSRFSIGAHVFLPVAGLILLALGKKKLFEKILLQFDRRYLTVLCPNFIKREAILKWACSRLPPRWSSQSDNTLSGGLRELWYDGSLLCTLINTVVPGACPNPHWHWKQPPRHAQTLAFKYFRVAPIFTEDELRKSLSSKLDRKFIGYLGEIQQSIDSFTENTEKKMKISDRYVARGMGLFSGEQFKTIFFYIYLDEKFDDGNESNIIIQVKGPFGSYGEAVSPKLINKNRKFRRKCLRERRSSLKIIENLQSLQSFSWNFGNSQKKKKKNKEYEEIEVEATLDNDRIEVRYFPRYDGMYEIHMIAGGQVIKGCPFNVHIYANNNNQPEARMEKPKNHRTARKLSGINEELPTLEIQTIEKGTVKREKFVFARSMFSIERMVENIFNSGSVTENIRTNQKKNLDKKVEVNFDDVDNAFNRNAHENHIKNVEASPEQNDGEIVGSEETTTHKENKSKLNENNKNSNDKANTEENKTEYEPSTVAPLPATNSKEIRLGKQHFTDDNNVKANSVATVPIFANNKIGAKNKQLVRDEFISKYVNTGKHKKPEPISDSSNGKFKHRLDDKYFKNIINGSDKVAKKTDDDVSDDKRANDNEDGGDTTRDERPKKTNGAEEIGDYSLDDNDRDTSPICSEHIAPEVTFFQMSVAERRKIFAQRTLESKPNSKISSFSENESSLGSSLIKFQTDGAAATLQHSVVSSRDCWSLYSTVSLPNLSLESELSSINSLKDKKSFWENVSRSSSSASTKSLSPRKPNNTLKELERSKLIWKKPNAANKEDTIGENSAFKSADDILSITESLAHQHSKKYQSMDDSLDNCTVLSIEDRKKLLLKQFYEKEKNHKQTMRKKTNTYTTRAKKDSSTINNIEDKSDVLFTPISTKIKRYKSALQLLGKETNQQTRTTVRKVKSLHIHNTSDVEKKEYLKSLDDSNLCQFNKAIQYFKNLETQSHNIEPRKLKDSEIQSPSARYRTNSLTISEKFSVNNLYDDVFGQRRSSFKGTPNKSAVVEALATFSRNPNYFGDCNDENDIKYEIFKQVKRRKRASLNSVFDLYY